MAMKIYHSDLWRSKELIMLFSGDLGNGYIKCRSSMCEAESYRSVISVVSTMLGNFKLDLSRKNHDLIIGFEGKTYAVGETVETCHRSSMCRRAGSR
jgi:hypothetical protein